MSEIKKRIASVERIAYEVGAIFDRERLQPDLATAVLLDLWARTSATAANGSEEARRKMVQAGTQLLDELSYYYAKGGK